MNVVQVFTVRINSAVVITCCPLGLNHLCRTVTAICSRPDLSLAVRGSFSEKQSGDQTNIVLFFSKLLIITFFIQQVAQMKDRTGS